MPEVNRDSMMLITISYQALQRAKNVNKTNSKIDCVIVIVFAAFFIEAYVNFLIDFLEKENDLRKYLGKEKSTVIGLNSKLNWFYHSFIDKSMSKRDIFQKLNDEFPDIETIIKFRDDVAHGIIDLSLSNIEDAEKLRAQAKKFVDQLIAIVKYTTGRDIPRVIGYDDAIA